MRVTFHHITAAIGVSLFLLGLRRYQLPYENGRFFDSKTGVVYLEQTAVSTGTALPADGG